jgi:hypothetical protein
METADFTRTAVTRCTLHGVMCRKTITFILKAKRTSYISIKRNEWSKIKGKKVRRKRERSNDGMEERNI